MGSPTKPEEDPVFAFLIRRFPPPGSDAGVEPCLSENLLTGLADGDLVAEERERLDRHLSGCEKCRALVGPLARLAFGADSAAVPKGEGISPPAQARVPVGSETAGRGRWLGVRPWVAAAAVLVGVAGAMLGLDLVRTFGGGRTDPEALLFASARNLARARPDLFGEFVPLSHEERVAPPSILRSGGIALLYPAGRILEARPAMRWEISPEVPEYEISLRTAEGDPLWHARSKASPFEYPPGERSLDPGVRYLCEVWGTGPQGETRSERTFEVASLQDQSLFEESLKGIEASAPERVGSLLAAHFALRRGFYREAEAAARAYLAAEPGDRLGLETLSHVLRRIGSSEADRLGSVVEAPVRVK